MVPDAGISSGEAGAPAWDRHAASAPVPTLGGFCTECGMATSAPMNPLLESHLTRLGGEHCLVGLSDGSELRFRAFRGGAIAGTSAAQDGLESERRRRRLRMRRHFSNAACR